MKSTINILIALIVCCTTAHAQEQNGTHNKPRPLTTTETNFYMSEGRVNIRDFAVLPDNGRVVFELNNVDQYQELKNIDSLLNAFMTEIAFYKDSLDAGQGNVRIDYALDEQLGIAKLRFKRHAPDGDIFMSRDGEKAKLKLGQDTVCIYVRHEPVYTPYDGKEKGERMHRMNHTQIYQVTFWVNSYKDIAKIAADKYSLAHIIDTLVTTKTKATLKNPFVFPSSTAFNPYEANGDKRNDWARTDIRLRRANGLMKANNSETWETLRRSDRFTVDVNMGAGFLRNTFAPYTQVGVSFITRSRRPYQDVYKEYLEGYNQWVFSVYASSYFAFEKNASGDYLMKDNWFVNAEVQEGGDLSMGLGYLISAKGDYFKGATGKVFISVPTFKKRFTLSPELIFTNDFKQVFPGLTLKVF